LSHDDDVAAVDGFAQLGKRRLGQDLAHGPIGAGSSFIDENPHVGRANPRILRQSRPSGGEPSDRCVTMDDVTDGLPAEVEQAIRDAIRAVLPQDGGNPAAAAISFPGGDYIVPTGRLAEDVCVVGHLLMAFFLFKEPPPEVLRVEALGSRWWCCGWPIM
jgi:hypothetical protein